MNNEEKLITWILCQFANNIENIIVKPTPPILDGIPTKRPTITDTTTRYSIDNDYHIEKEQYGSYVAYTLFCRGVSIHVIQEKHLVTIKRILDEFRNYEMKKSIPYQQRQKELESVIRELRI